MRLALITLLGVITLFLAAAAIYAIHRWIAVSPLVYVAIFCGTLGVIYAGYAKLVMLEIQWLRERD